MANAALRHHHLGIVLIKRSTPLGTGVPPPASVFFSVFSFLFLPVIDQAVGIKCPRAKNSYFN
jgi:hypothetical protein